MLTFLFYIVIGINIYSYHLLFLDSTFDTIMAAGATCKSMLHDALPLLRKICIDKSSQMNLEVASRFRDIREIHINSLLTVEILEEGTDDEFKDISVDFESRNSIVPFLSRFNSSLERVHFGMKNEDGKGVEGVSPVECHFFEGDDAYPYEGDRDRLKSCLDLMSAAYKCGSIPQNLYVSGLCCPDATNRNGFRGSNCQICTRACKRFPLASVAEFECRGSSTNNAQSLRMFGLDVCLERAQVESIIESRPGGKDLLCSEKRLFHLLGRGRRYVVTGEEEGKKSLHAVKYKEEELDEIKRVIEYASLDVKKLPSTTISNAIMRSFATDDNVSTPLKEQCYISETSLDHLRDKLGLPINKKDFERPLADLLEHTEKILWVLNQCDAEVNDDGTEEEIEFYEDLQLDFLRLIRRFLEVENNPPIELVASDGAVCLNNWLARATKDDYQLEAAHSLMNILVKGTDENRKMVVDAGTITSFSRLLESSKDCIVEVALLSLVEIATKGSIDDIKTNAIEKLVKLLDSKNDDWVENSLRVLVASKDHIKDNMNASLLPHLVRIMKVKATVSTDMIANSSILLRQVLEGDNPPVRSLIDDFEAVPLILEIMEQTEKKDDTVRTNLTHAIIVIGRARALDGIISTQIFEETSFIPVLVSLVESQDSDISEGAISAVGNVANMVFSPSNATSMTRAGLPFSSVSCRDLLIKAGIMKPLLRVLGSSSSTRPALSPSAMNQRLKQSAMNIMMETNRMKQQQQAQQAAGAKQQQMSGGVRSTDSKSSSSSSDTASSNSSSGTDNVGEEDRKTASSASILNVASWTFKCCCRGEPFDTTTLKACLEILPSLFVKEEQVVVDNSCWALFHMLDGLKSDELNQVIDDGFLEPLLQLLPFAQHNTQLPLLKALHLISSAGDTCVQSITNLNGVSCISKVLYSPLAANQELGLNIIANILAIDQDQILDDAISPLFQIIRSTKDKKLVNKIIYQMANGGNSTQIRKLVDHGCIEHLCDMLTADCNNDAKSAICALNDVSSIRHFFLGSFYSYVKISFSHRISYYRYSKLVRS